MQSFTSHVKLIQTYREGLSVQLSRWGDRVLDLPAVPSSLNPAMLILFCTLPHQNDISACDQQRKPLDSPLFSFPHFILGACYVFCTPSMSLFFFFNFFILLLFFFVFLLFLWAAPAAYGGSQARGQIRAVAAGLRQSHSNAGYEPRLQPTPQLTATPDR